jgi:hypothetical protein
MIQLINVTSGKDTDIFPKERTLKTSLSNRLILKKTNWPRLFTGNTIIIALPNKPI